MSNKKEYGNNIFTVEALVQHLKENFTEIDGKWVPARPYRCDSLWTS
jgi:hypothetical protein